MFMPSRHEMSAMGYRELDAAYAIAERLGQLWRVWGPSETFVAWWAGGVADARCSQTIVNLWTSSAGWVERMEGSPDRSHIGGFHKSSVPAIVSRLDVANPGHTRRHEAAPARLGSFSDMRKRASGPQERPAFGSPKGLLAKHSDDESGGPDGPATDRPYCIRMNLD
jgi:hypothetical protein